jgi:NAD(P)H-hydrate epimerase
MRPLLSCAAAAALDVLTQAEYGVSAERLMELAAARVLDVLIAEGVWPAAFTGGVAARASWAGATRVAAICGSGNNAGDALVLLRMAAFAGEPGLAAVIPDRLGEAAAARAREAEAAGVRLIELASPEALKAVAEAALVIDAVAGTGVRGPLRGRALEAAELCGSARGRLVALDLPSGVGAYEGAAESLSPSKAAESPRPAPPKAELTVCVAPRKLELYFPAFRGAAGRITAAEGLFPLSRVEAMADARLLEDADLAELLPPLAPEAHKGSRGAVGVYGGAVGALGAGLIAARAASAAGAGVVSFLVRDESYAQAAGRLQAQIVRPLSLGSGRRLDAALVGPGLGLDETAETALRELWDGPLPLVVDADALRLIARDDPSERSKRAAPLIMTPHPGELASLAAAALGRPGDPEAVAVAAERWRYDAAALALETARAYGAALVCKDATSFIAAPDGSLAVWDGREPSLGAGGSGDALAGFIAGLLGRGATAWDAARAGVIAHGLAGRRLAAQKGFYDAGELPKALASLAYERTQHG